MQTITEVIEGNILFSTVTVTLTEGGALVDPTTLDFNYVLNSDPTTKVTLAYVSATNPAPGVVARLSEGVYQAQVDLTDLAGTLQRYWQSTGAGQAVSATANIVIPSLPF